MDIGSDGCTAYRRLRLDQRLSQFGIVVSRDGSIDWLCWLRFDSSAYFAAILDPRQGGRFQIRPRDDFRVSRRYSENSNVLETELRTASAGVRPKRRSVAAFC